MSKESIIKAVDTFFNVDDYDEKELEKYKIIHSYMAIGFLVFGIVVLLVIANVVSPDGIELDYVRK